MTTPTAELQRIIELGEKATKGPWRKCVAGNFGNVIEADSGKRRYHGDVGYRPVAAYQDCTAAERADEQDANRAANGDLIAAAGNLPDLARELLQAREALTPKPIDTAPKDGTKILLLKIAGHPAHPTALWWCVLGFWSSRWNNWNDGVEPAGLADPNYWMPAPSLTALLPQPTAAQEAKNG